MDEFDNILGESEIEALFPSEESQPSNNDDDEPADKEGSQSKDNDDDDITEAATLQSLFGIDEDEPEEPKEQKKQPESVGNEDENKKGGKEDTESQETGDTSTSDIYSSLAKALAEDGVFPNLDEKALSSATDAQSFSDLIEAEIKARFDEKQQRILNALENNVPVSEIKKYENTLNYLDSITETALNDESENGEKLRRNIIFEDFLSKGYSKEKAQKLTERVMDAGTDLEDAKDALQSIKETYGNQYKNLLKEAQDKEEKSRENAKKKMNDLKDTILNSKTLFGDLDIDMNTRKKAFDCISKPVYKDPTTGMYYTALQKFQAEHEQDLLKYMGVCYALTDGFKDFDSFTKGKVKKEVKKGMRELENLLSSSKNGFGGSMNMVTGRKKEADDEWLNDPGFALALRNSKF